MDAPAPLARLEYFRKEIGLDEAKFSAIRPYAERLSAHGRRAGAYLDALTRKLAPRTRMEINLEYSGGALKDFWTRWYQSLWTRPWDDGFLSELWDQGLNAARMGIDLQYVMLGEIKSRQLFINAVREEVPQEDRGPVASAVNDLLDLCLLVRTKGHASWRSHLAAPLLQGIFHQTRNPLTIIGGTAMRLMRQGGPEVKNMAQVILDEALRLERMTRDISTYNAVVLAEPTLEPVAVRPVLEQTLEGLRQGPEWPEGTAVSLELDQAHPEVECDAGLLREIFKEVLVNAIEALPASSREIAVASRVDKGTPSHLSVAVRGCGELPRGQDLEQLFLPFNSSKPKGTGFGLAIAQAAARKCFGHVGLAQTDDGVVCTVKLPLKGKIEDAGFTAQRDF